MMLSILKKMLPRPLKRSMRRAWQNTRESVQYQLLTKNLPTGRIGHVIFVCKGNICRSAFAEYYLRQQFPDGTLRIESCGIDVDQGLFSPPEAVKVASEYRLGLESHQSKGLACVDIHNADLIVPMEYRQYLQLKALYPSETSKIRLVRDFAPWPERLNCNINDPYGAGEREFRRCFWRLKRALDGLKCHAAIYCNPVQVARPNK
jgi:protein-tyrosine phosphatase